MITRKTLSRIPKFAPVREAVHLAAQTFGPRAVRWMLDRQELPPDEVIVRWILDAPDPATHANRLRALYVALDEWEAEHRSRRHAH